MTATVKTIVSDGVTTLHSFEFDYLRKDFVKVTVEGQPVGFEFTSPYTIHLAAPAPEGSVIIIRRVTDRDRLVTFVDGSILLAGDLNVSALQATHIAAEALDIAGGSLIIDEEGAYSAGFRRIALIGEPRDPNDAVTKGWAETEQSAQLAQTITARTAAQAARDAAQASQTAAAGSATTATGQATIATTKAGEAAASATAAAGSASTANTQASSAATSAASASGSAATATTKAGEAAASAAAAATFDPAAYVAKAGDATIAGVKTFAVAKGSIITLPSAASITADLLVSNRFYTVANQALTINKPANMASAIGQSFLIIVRQDGTGNRAITLGGTGWLRLAGEDIEWNLSPNGISAIVGEIINTTEILVSGGGYF